MDQQTEQPGQSGADSAMQALQDRMFGSAQASDPVEASQEDGEVSEDGASADDEQATDQTTEPKAELVEIETDDGEKYEVPAKLRDAFMRTRDYTAKTTELAQLRAQAQATFEAVTAAQQFEQVIAGDRMKLAAKQSELEGFKGVDWMALDTDTHLKLRTKLDQLKSEIDELSGGIRGKYAQFEHWQKSHKAKLTQDGLQYLRSQIPTWGEASQKEAAGTLRQLGYSDNEIENVYDPRFVRMAYEAAQYRKLTANKGTAAQAVAKAPPVVKPGGQTFGQSAAVDRMNFAKAMKHAKSDGQKADLIGTRLANKFRF